MKRIIFILTLLILLSSIASAEIIINQQPEAVYSLGDYVKSTITITTTTGIYGYLSTNIMCDGQLKPLPDKSITLPPNEEERIEVSLLLIKTFVNELSGNCQFKFRIGENYVLSDEFAISDFMTLELTSEDVEFSPQEEVVIEGKAFKENGEPVDGFIDLIMIYNTTLDNRTYPETINNGFFSIKFTVGETTKAGPYLIRLNGYEKDPLGELTNKGFMDFNMVISQVPTSLEVAFETPEVEPGTNAMIKAILHDQTGQNIPATSIITIKNLADKVLQQTEIATDEYLEFPIEYNQAPTEFKVVGVSNKLTGESTFNVTVKEEVEIEILNNSVLITNIGNVMFCNKTVLIKIGEANTFDIDPCLDVDKDQKYRLTAPDGEYQVEIIMNGNSILSESIPLTGRAVDVKESGGTVGKIFQFWWIFIIIILGLIAFMIFKKGYKRSFVGRFHFKKKDPKKSESKVASSETKEHEQRFNALMLESKTRGAISLQNKAQLSLSLKGEKQTSSIVNLKIRNLKELKSSRARILLSKDKRAQEGSVEQVLQSVISYAETKKAYTYIAADNFFFILAPTTTKTFENEMPALEIAQKAKEILDSY
ncbi:hypothetical protein ACFLZJ_01915, partial [Nanoarchaeota archaeon]